MPFRLSARLRAGLSLVALAALTAACTTSVVSGSGSVGSAVPSPGVPSSPGAPSRPSGAPSSATLRFGSCSGIDLGSSAAPSSFDVSCGKLAVPLDYADPSGRQITLALVRLHRKDGSGHQPLLIDPGGPGASAVQFAVGEVGQLPRAITNKYDLVGFDPRGVGSSAPVRCTTDGQKDALTAAQPDVRTPAGFIAAKDMAQQVARACQAKYGSALDDFDTVATTRDMERIRTALRVDKLDYLGFSYGTELGAQYAHLYPNRVGAFVLDGAVDPLTDDITSFANQLAGFEQAFDQFAGWCGQHAPCNQLGNPRQVVYDLVKRTTTSPMASSAPHETRKATSSIVLLGVLLGLYEKSFWPVLGESLLLAQRGDARGLFALADVYSDRDAKGHYSNETDANLTIGCNDSKPGPTDDTIRATTASWVQRFPMFGLWSAASLFGCQQWQPKRSVPPKPTAPQSANTILVVGNLHDPATPYQGAKDLAATLGKARLLTWDGEGHTAFLHGSDCIDQAVTAYLVDGTLPPTGKTCPR